MVPILLHESKTASLVENITKKSENCYVDTYLSVNYVPDQHWLYVDWTGYQTEESVMKGGMMMLEALRKYKLQKVLNDNTRVIGIWTPAAKWAGEVFFPKMVESGLKYFAWIYSPSRLSQISTDQTLTNTVNTENIRTFYNIDEATAWLAGCK